ncbi:MAG: hypothetical protein PEPC_01703 [Peptostreptococcus russellii]
MICQIVGFLGGVPKETEKGFSFPLSSKRYDARAGKEITDWVNCFVNWKGGITSKLLKGSSVFVSGELIPELYEKEDKTQMLNLTLIVDRIQFAGYSKKPE